MKTGQPCQQGRMFRDALGVGHPRAAADARIVSLVPSITELLIDLGLVTQVVGRTGFCVHPEDSVRSIPKVGGTKTVDLDRVRALQPSHVIVNMDENSREVYDHLLRFVPHVVVTHPLAPEDNVNLYRLLGGIFDRESKSEFLCDALTAALRSAHEDTINLPKEQVLYLIWRNPWMTVSGDTYIARTLAAVGWESPTFRQNDRYPEIELSEKLGSGIDRVMLSSEPYPFRQKHLSEVGAALGLKNPHAVMLIDGEMCSWYGSRAVRAMQYLAKLRRKIQ